MTTDTVIYFTNPILTPLVTETALAGCTTTTWAGDEWRVEKRWPSVSTGETILWEILSHAARRDPIPADLVDRAHARLDHGNHDVVWDVLIDLAESLAP